MPRLETARRIAIRWFTSIPFYILLGLILGFLISIPAIPKPKVAVIPISSAIFGQSYTADILAELKSAREDNSVKAIVLQIDSPGGSASSIEPIFLDVLELKQHKPVVAFIGSIGASGGYYIAVASNLIYAGPSSTIGSIGVIGSLPTAEALDENTITTGPFKSTGGSRRKTVSFVATLKQQFIDAVISQRGDRLNISDAELSRAEVYSGAESLRNGLIDEISTIGAAIEKAAILAGIRNYEVERAYISLPFLGFFGFSSMVELKSQTGLIPTYYYLYFESE